MAGQELKSLASVPLELMLTREISDCASNEIAAKTMLSRTISADGCCLNLACRLLIAVMRMSELRLNYHHGCQCQLTPCVQRPALKMLSAPVTTESGAGPVKAKIPKVQSRTGEPVSHPFCAGATLPKQNALIGIAPALAVPQGHPRRRGELLERDPLVYIGAYGIDRKFALVTLFSAAC